MNSLPPIPTCGATIANALLQVEATLVMASPDIRVKLRKANYPLKDGAEELVQAAWLEVAVDELDCDDSFRQSMRYLAECNPEPPEVDNALQVAPTHVSHIPECVHFPDNIPNVQFSPSSLTSSYGLTEVPTDLRGQISKYSTWCTTPIQLSRALNYAQPVQSSTMHTSVQGILGYLGFLTLQEKVGTKDGLYLYWNPDFFSRFVAFLLARGVGRGQVLKHISIAKKVSTFLRTQVVLDIDKSHGSKVEEWLSTLERQVGIVMPRSVKDSNSLPKSDRVRQWVDYLKEVAQEAVAQDKVFGRRKITFQTAKMVSANALIIVWEQLATNTKIETWFITFPSNM